MYRRPSANFSQRDTKATRKNQHGRGIFISISRSEEKEKKERQEQRIRAKAKRERWLDRTSVGEGKRVERERERERGEETPWIRVCLALLVRVETSVGRLSAAKFTATE